MLAGKFNNPEPAYVTASQNNAESFEVENIDEEPPMDTVLVCDEGTVILNQIKFLN